MARRKKTESKHQRVIAERVEEAIEEARQEASRRRWENAIPILHHAVEQSMILHTKVRGLKIVRRGGAVKRPALSDSTIQAFDILGVFYEAEPEALIGVADVADELGMSRATTHRYIITLCYLGQLEQHGPSRKYRLPRLHVLEGEAEGTGTAEVHELAKAA